MNGPGNIDQALPPAEDAAKQTFDTPLLIGVALLVAVLAGNAGLTYRNTRQLDENSHWVVHTHEVLHLTNQVLAALTEAETGQRGFLITGGDQYFQFYEAASARSREILTKLESKTSDNPDQQPRIAKLKEMTATRLSLLEQAIDLRRKSAEEAAAFIAAGKGKAQMDAIRRHIAEMESVERALLDEREKNSATAYRIAVTTGLLTTGLALVVLAAFVWLLNRSMRTRQRAALVIAEQRERLRTTLASIGDGVISTDIDGRITNLNPVAQSLTGWTNTEAMGQPLDTVFRIVNEDTRNPVENPATRALREGVIVGLANHTVLIAKDGTERPIDDSAAPIRCDEGKLVGCVLVFRDITDRNRRERQARESHARKTAILNAALDCIITIDHDGNVLEFNPAAESTFGYRSQDVVGRKMAELIIPPSLRDQHRHGIAHYLATGEGPVLNRRLEITAMRSDGSEFPIELSVTPIVSDGAPIFTAHLRDITDRNKLWESARRLVAVVESSDDAIVSKSLDGIIQSWNPAAERLFGYTAEEAVGRHISMLIPSDRLAEEDHIISQIRSGERVDHLDTIRVRKDGRSIQIALTVSPVKDSDGRVIGASKIARDIAERKRLESELRQLAADLSEADRRKNEFLALLAHELRNPLAPILNAVQVLRLKGSTGEAVQAAAEMMERQISQMVRLVDDLLDVSRISRGTIELRRGRVELASVVHHAVEAADSLVQCMGHNLTLTLPPQPIYLNADPTRLAQIIGNLLNNACKFTDKGGRISLTAEQDGDQVVIRVRDTGIGLAADQLPRIFDMFVQVDSSLERSAGGLGIGLPLVKTLVEMHGGTVEARSAGLGRGSEFIVRLPALAAAEPPLLEPSPGDARPSTARRILVVDDNRDSADSLAMLLELTGNQTRTAYDGFEAVDAAAAFRPDVVLLDIGLPRQNGYEAARQIRQQPWGKPMLLVALTGWGKDEDRQKSKEAGFDGHLVKPVDRAALSKLLGDS